MSLSPCGLNAMVTFYDDAVCVSVGRGVSGVWLPCGLFAFARPKHDDWACCPHRPGVASSMHVYSGCLPQSATPLLQLGPHSWVAGCGSDELAPGVGEVDGIGETNSFVEIDGVSFMVTDMPLITLLLKVITCCSIRTTGTLS